MFFFCKKWGYPFRLYSLAFSHGKTRPWASSFLCYSWWSNGEKRKAVSDPLATLFFWKELATGFGSGLSPGKRKTLRTFLPVSDGLATSLGPVLVRSLNPSLSPELVWLMLRKEGHTDTLSHIHTMWGGQLGFEVKCISNCESWSECLRATILSNLNKTRPNHKTSFYSLSSF